MSIIRVMKDKSGKIGGSSVHHKGNEGQIREDWEGQVSIIKVMKD